MTDNTDIRSRLSRTHKGTTLVELVVAVSMMVIVLSTLVPMISSVRLSWEASENNAEVLQKGRIILDHLSQHLANSDGDMAFVAATSGNEGWYSVKNGFTEGKETNITSADGVMGYISTDGNEVTPSVTHSYPKRQVAIGFVVQVLNPGNITTIEGDLLIAAVAVDGEDICINWRQAARALRTSY